MSLVRRWVEVLRDGSYRQTRNVLRDGDGYCCLGVLCDIAGAEWEETVSGEFKVSYRGDWSFTELPWVLRKEYGVTTELMDELAARNDGRPFLSPDGTSVVFDPHDFEQIADVIERELLDAN